MKKIFSQLFSGTYYYLKVFPFINKHKLWGYVILTAIVSLLLYISMAYVAWISSSALSNWVNQLLGIADWSSYWALLKWTVVIIVKIFVFYLYFQFFKFFVLVICSPILAFTAERINQILYNPPQAPFNWKLFFKNIWRTININLKNVFIELFLTTILFLLSFISFLTPITGALIIIISSYFVGYGIFDFRNEFRNLNVSESDKMVWRNKGLATGVGLIFNLLILIPFLGALIAPSMALVAGSLAVYEFEEEKSLSEEILK